jgi:hypothetical protein
MRERPKRIMPEASSNGGKGWNTCHDHHTAWLKAVVPSLCNGIGVALRDRSISIKDQYKIICEVVERVLLDDNT